MSYISKKKYFSISTFFLQRLLSQRHAQKCCIEYSNIYLYFLFCLNSYFFFYFYYIFYFNIFLFNYWFIIFRIFGTLEILPSPSTLDARPKGRLPPASSYWRVRLLPRGVEAFWTKKEGRKGGGKRAGKLGSALQSKSNTCFFSNILMWILYISRHAH